MWLMVCGTVMYSVWEHRYEGMAWGGGKARDVAADTTSK